MRVIRLGSTVVLVALLVLGGCGDGEDRPGQVSSESGGGSVSGTGSASGTAGGAATTAAEGDGHDHEHGAAFDRSEADIEVKVRMRDFAFSMPSSVNGKKVLFHVANDGPSAHEFVVVGADGEPVKGIDPFDKAMEKTVAIELEPGSYKAICSIKVGDRTHQQLGMESSFSVE